MGHIWLHANRRWGVLGAKRVLIQGFLAGGFSLVDYPCQSPPHYCVDSYIIDTMKDLHQLPWLERFVSVISDSYNDDYIQWTNKKVIDNSKETAHTEFHPE